MDKYDYWSLAFLAIFIIGSVTYQYYHPKEMILCFAEGEDCDFVIEPLVIKVNEVITVEEIHTSTKAIDFKCIQDGKPCVTHKENFWPDECLIWEGNASDRLDWPTWEASMVNTSTFDPSVPECKRKRAPRTQRAVDDMHFKKFGFSPVCLRGAWTNISINLKMLQYEMWSTD